MDVNLSLEEQAAASVVAALAGKHERDDAADAAGGVQKKTRVDEPNPIVDPLAAPVVEPADFAVAEAAIEAEPDVNGEELKPAPFFYYKDYSKFEDPDALTPLTAPGRVPNFPAKMHAILARPDLADVVCWMPHGRSWKILKPRDFEVRVIPTYFEHAKFSSFIRQANGWGFRRITTGRDRNSYYHPLFLRGLPHLCKEMKRPGVAKKIAADPDHEPDFYAISEMLPVPEKAEDEDAILLHCTLQGGPKARMPIYSGSWMNKSSTFTDVKLPPAESKKAAAASITAPAPPQLTPRDQEALSSFEASLGASADVHKKITPQAQTNMDTSESSSPAPASPTMFAPFMLPQAFAQLSAPSTGMTLPANSVLAGPNKMSTLAAANQLAFANPFAAFQAGSAASQFAAGFAAATAFSQHQMQSMMASFQMPQQMNNVNAPMPGPSTNQILTPVENQTSN